MDKTMYPIDNKQANKDKDMQKVMHVFSHDLRNPLLNIQALMQEMNMSILDAKEAQAAQNQDTLQEIVHEDLPDVMAMLQESANRMDEMIAGINDIYHCMYDALECEHIDMQHMFERCFGLLQLEEAGVRLQCSDLPTVYADPLAVKRLVCELLANAKQAMLFSAGEKRIAVQAEQQSGIVSFQVSDQGCGFVATEIDRVFEPFFSGQHFEDTAGLGLARVKALVGRHGGAVRLLSVENSGAVVVFSLPMDVT